MASIPASQDAPEPPNQWIVVGYHGFIGRNVVQCLRAAKCHVYGVSHDDLESLRVAIEQRNIAGIVNCAGLCRGAPEEVRASQVGFVNELIKILLAAGADQAPRFVQMSTERVYGWKKHPKVPSGEQDPSEVWSIDVENALLDHYPNEKLCLLRPANVYGVGAKPHYNSAVATWIELALSGQDLVVHGDGHLRNFVYIKDLQRVVKSVCLAEAMPLAVDVRPEAADSITIPAGIISQLSGVKMQIPDGEHTESEPELTANWTTPAVNAVSTGLVEGWTPLQEGLERVFRHEKAMRVTRDANPVVIPNQFPGARGRMVELFGPETQRVYEIVVEPGYTRGNHCHEEQHEEFYVSEGDCIFEFQPGLPLYLPEALCQLHMSSRVREKVNVKPTFMHTLWNPSPVHPALCIVSSTQKYIPNSTPDCFWPQNDYPDGQ